MWHLRRLQVPQVVIELCCVLLFVAEVVPLSSTNDGYFYRGPEYRGDSMRQIGWNSQQYPPAVENLGWLPKFQPVQSMRMDYSSPTSVYGPVYNRPTYPDDSVLRYRFGSPWQNNFNRRMQQSSSAPLFGYDTGPSSGYFYPNSGYGYGQPTALAWKRYGNRREDLMMNGDAWRSASTTTTTTPRPHRPRKMPVRAIVCFPI
ncbi:hypothetical protein pipiens_005834 [Culex pipiens pipiens]|uniref:Uncharacterized protein n=1 Tax=Culex pipiens pipiens TaxID=38569 RepID=A0ABD1DTE4_CULPP